MPRGPVNLRRGLAEGELSQRYRRLRDEHVDDDPFDPRDNSHAAWDFQDEVRYDDYWNPWNQTSPLDFALEKLWHGLSDVLLRTRIEIPQVRAVDPVELRPHDADALVEALHARVQHLCEPEIRPSIEQELDGPRAQLRDAVAGEPRLLGWIARHRGPALMALLLSPFWVRSPASWRPPAGAIDDDAALTRSLLEHLFARFPVPPALFVPWTGMEPPSLKWATWLVLIGGGASLRRAAPRFGWRISARLVHHLHTAPEGLQPIQAILWAEIVQRGGTTIELARLRRHRAYIFDSTVAAVGMVAEDDGDARGRPAHYRAFWIAAIDWLVRHRDALTDEDSERILDWAMHRFTEDLARDTPAQLRFTWSGRTPAAAGELAAAYAREIRRSPYGDLLPVAWARRGWDWTLVEGEHEWTIRELGTSRELAAESLSMHHCVGSYAHRCIAGLSAIFSARLDGVRAFTIEIEPATRRVVQARGLANRTCTDIELALVARWLDATKPEGV